MPKLPLRRWIGIDPGKDGGIAVLGSQGVEWYSRLPVTRLDIANILRSITTGAIPAVVTIEKIHSRPEQGAPATFTFGRGYGFLEGCLTTLGIRCQEVDPKDWQKALHVSPRKKKTKKRKNAESKLKFKDRLRDIAQQMFPGLDLWNQTLGEQRAVCDALLIAEYCRRTWR